MCHCQPLHAEEEPTAMELAIYTETTENGSLSTRKSHLSSLPPEVLSLILVELPVDSYLDLVQTSKFLSEFLEVNVAFVCKICIASRFPLEGAVMSSVKVNGWIVPTHREITILESYVLGKKRYHDRAHQIKEEDDAYGQDLRLKLTQPGPQFLLWLQFGPVLTKVPRNSQGQLVINRLGTVAFLRWLNEDLSGDEDDDESRLRGFARRELLWYHGVPEN